MKKLTLTLILLATTATFACELEEGFPKAIPYLSFKTQKNHVDEIKFEENIIDKTNKTPEKKVYFGLGKDDFILLTPTVVTQNRVSFPDDNKTLFLKAFALPIVSYTGMALATLGWNCIVNDKYGVRSSLVRLAYNIFK